MKMGEPMLRSITRRIEHVLSYPGIDENTLLERKNVWLGDIVSGSGIVVMTLLGWLLDLPTISMYGLILLTLVIPNILALPFMKGHVALIHFISQQLIIWITFFFMIRLGGLLNSAGLVFTGMTILTMSFNYQNDRMTIALFLSYLLSLILIALLQPWLVLAPEMTPGKNLLFFTVNFSWQGGYVMILILNNINQKKKISEAKAAEALRLKELDEVKTRLFTNITHEFRTPLTIIQGMAGLIRENPGDWLEEGTEKIRQNGQQLLTLVNQMLDLSKLDAGAMPLHTYQQDIIAQLRYLSDSFQSFGHLRNVELRFETDTTHFLMDYDADKLMQVMVNLLSNAMKYSGNGGRVIFSTYRSSGKGQNRVIAVTDNGPGIPPEQLEHIFDRFYRIEGTEVPVEQGTGLGLSLSSELVKLMNGSISVESKPGEGTTFRVSLPVTNNAPLRDVMKPGNLDGPMTNATPASMIKPFPVTAGAAADHAKPVLLVVEDNPDLVEYLAALLHEDYYLETAPNGKAGLDKVFEFMPDVILTDVMMPELDGISMLDRIKNDPRSSHIPVVMLTAKADVASRLEGLERGADAYLAKPFHEGELRIQLKNLIANRRLLHERYAHHAAFPATDDRSVRMEDAFMIKVREVMERHLDEETFGIEVLCREVSMSRAQLYRKFKTLTDKTVFEYLQSFRLHKARTLLESTGLNVSEVAFDVGFKNPSHFSRAFTAEFGKNPTEFRKRLRQNNFPA